MLSPISCFGWLVDILRPGYPEVGIGAVLNLIEHAGHGSGGCPPAQRRVWTHQPGGQPGRHERGDGCRQSGLASSRAAVPCPSSLVFMAFFLLLDTALAGISDPARKAFLVDLIG